jgi:stage II sporulation protein P
MYKGKKIHLNYIIYYILIIIIILGGMTYNKFEKQKDEIIPVWSSCDEEYYGDKIKNVSSIFNPSRWISTILRIKPGVPISYLKHEFPLLTYYTPEGLKVPTQTIYKSEGTNEFEGKIIKLKFDLREEKTQEDKYIDKSSERHEEKYNFNEEVIIAIYHTHTSETYFDDPRPQDSNGHVLPGVIGNVAKVGQELAKILSEKYGFNIIHTTKVHDENYALSYFNSRKTARELITNYPDLNMILDIHRDGLKEGDSQKFYTTEINNEKVARVMLVVTNGNFEFAHLNLRDYHPEWRRNLDFAKKLSNKMEEMYPGLLMRMEIRDTTYNQDLHPRSLLLEIGDYNNSTGEAIRSVRLLADVIANLIYTE